MAVVTIYERIETSTNTENNNPQQFFSSKILQITVKPMDFYGMSFQWMFMKIMAYELISFEKTTFVIVFV